MAQVDEESALGMQVLSGSRHHSARDVSPVVRRSGDPDVVERPVAQCKIYILLISHVF